MIISKISQKSLVQTYPIVRLTGQSFCGNNNQKQDNSVENTSFDFTPCDVNLILSNSIKKATLSVTVTNKEYNQDDYTPGIGEMYEIILNNKIKNMAKGADAINNYSYVQPDSRRVDILHKSSDYSNVINSIKQNFIDIKITQEELEDAKDIIKEAFKLYKKTGNSNYYFEYISDINQDEFNNIIDSVTLGDLQDYHKNYLKNSKIGLSLQLNKDYYKNNHNKIDEMIF